MKAKTLVITGALTLSLLVPAGAAVAAPADHHPGPLGGVLNIFGDHDRRDGKNGEHDNRFGRKHVKRFVISATIRSVDTDDRTITVGHGHEGGDTRKVKVDDDAMIWRDGDRANLRDLEKGDHVRMTGEKKDGKWVATRIRAVS
jgi:Cu/Ag efflux protein CusF